MFSQRSPGKLITSMNSPLSIFVYQISSVTVSDGCAVKQHSVVADIFAVRTVKYSAIRQRRQVGEGHSRERNRNTILLPRGRQTFEVVNSIAGVGDITRD